MSKSVAIETTKDRFVTPTFDARGFRNIQLVIPTLDDDSNVIVEASRYPHEWNYPFWKGSSHIQKYADNNIILEWRMDDADGTTITDQVAGVALTEQGDPTFATSAATIGLGNGLVFDGTGDAFDVLKSGFPAGLTMPTTGDFSVEVVFKATNADTGDGDTLVAYRDGAAGVGWQMNFDANQYVDFDVDDGTETKLTGATDAATGSIVHALASLDRSGNGVLYINGSTDDTTSIAARTGSVDPAAGASVRFAIGGDAARTAGDCFYGTIYFVRVYNKALSATEALDNYRVLMNQGGPKGWNPIAAPQDGLDLITSLSGGDPATFDLSPFLPDKHDYFLRAVCATEQTTTPAELPFEWIYR